jgi:hypothetical protein
MTIENTFNAAGETNLRNQDLSALAQMLKTQQTEKVDFVAPAQQIRADNGLVVINGAEAKLTEHGVTQVDGIYRPTSVMIDGFAAKLGVPVGYLKKTHRDRPDLFDANVNGWLHGNHAGVPGDDRSFLVRTFRGDHGPGLGRALLSDKFKLIDNLDALTATLDGVRAAGVPIDIRGCDLTESRMYVRIQAEQIKAYAPTLLKGYRSPFSGASGDDNPTVFAGFVISNSEVGAGAFTLTPQLVVQVCDNGMTITKDVRRAVHVGSRMDEGLIQWSDETREQEINLIRSRTRDAVRTFLDVGYVTRQITKLEQIAGKPLDGAADVVRTVGKKLTFSETHIDGVLDHFISGGQRTAGGVLQAVTAYAQVIADADVAANIEAQGIRAMELAAAI